MWNNSTNMNLQKWPDNQNDLWYRETNSKSMCQYFCLYMVFHGCNLKNKTRQTQPKTPSSVFRWSQCSDGSTDPSHSACTHILHAVFLLIINFANSACSERQTLHFSFNKAQRGNFGAWDDFKRGNIEFKSQKEPIPSASCSVRIETRTRFRETRGGQWTW